MQVIVPALGDLRGSSFDPSAVVEGRVSREFSWSLRRAVAGGPRRHGRAARKLWLEVPTAPWPLL